MRKLIGRAGEYITSALEELGYETPLETNETIVTFSAGGVGGDFKPEEKRRLRQLSNLYSLGGVCPENEYQSSKWSESFKSLVKKYMEKNDKDRKEMRYELTGGKKKETDTWRGVDGIFAKLLNTAVRDKKKRVRDLFKKHGLAFPVPSGKSEDEWYEIMKTAVFKKFSTPEGRKLINDLLVDEHGRMKFWVAEALVRGKITEWTIQIKDRVKTGGKSPKPPSSRANSGHPYEKRSFFTKHGGTTVSDSSVAAHTIYEAEFNPLTRKWPKGSILSPKDSLKLEKIKAMITEYNQLKASGSSESILEEKSDNISKYLSHELDSKLMKACLREIPLFKYHLFKAKRWKEYIDRQPERSRGNPIVLSDSD